MKVKLTDRVAQITRMLHAVGFEYVNLTLYRPDPTGTNGYYKLRATKDDYKVYISELLFKGSIIKYSYTLLHRGRVILRYDNAPHYPQMETFPHHKP